ncbi:fused (3R)-hydroxyacyl-ACP dehydratase subunits HadA/HadB [Nocardia sp. NRRL WC-3656]|uniref:fused (3R)-hydroxyacyl-ACP dehydratase subunits HadA/HadB n=1 Tax=Nocardia sp. NRRL WC-3656 TaxID=1463824 RepID=UPI0009DE78E8|nr:fused (3R)-hydroxyacyl-ACP dehydratase subunits HadA/HadB [Nocardia sp. NRRL WC-3656]
MSELTVDVAAYTRSLVGYAYRVEDYYEVGREKIREYARAVQDHGPVHWREAAAAEYGYGAVVAPPTFLSIPAMLANRRLFERVITGYDVYVQTDQVFEFHRPVVSGDRLVSDVEVAAVRTIAGKDLITVTNTFTDQFDEVVHVMHTTAVGVTGDDIDAGIGGAIERVIMHGVGAPSAAQGLSEAEVLEAAVAPSRDHRYSEVSRKRVLHNVIRFDEVAVGDELPPRTARVTRGDLVNYAGVSGDANPIHWHDGVAALAGLPDVIAHGMLTMGLGAGFVTGWLGDPGALTRYAVRLSNYTIVDARSAGVVEFSGRIKSLDPQARTAVVVVVAKSAGRKIFGLATAEVRLA